jgi:integrase
MASVLKIGDSWRAQIRRAGHKPVTATFPRKRDACTWAIKTEAGMGKRGVNGIFGVKMSAVIDQYIENMIVERSKANVLKHLRAGLGDIMLDELTAADVIRYVESRGYGPATALQEMSILNTALRTARLVFGYSVPNIMEHAREALKLTGKIGKSEERERRPTAEELKKLCEHFDEHSSWPMRDIIGFAVHTAMRAGEITRLRWADYSPTDKTVIIRDRKDPGQTVGNNQTVPLLNEAIEIIERQPRNREPQYEDDDSHLYIFPYNHKSFSSLFPRACTALGIDGLRFHDLRHEGTSRLFERGYQIHEVALFTGHKDWKMLQRYTHLKAAELRRLPATAASSIPMSDSRAQA